MEMTTVLILGRELAGAKHARQKALREKKSAEAVYTAAELAERRAEKMLDAAITEQLDKELHVGKG